MDEKLDLFKALARRMDWLGQRHQLLARNMANADTPGFVPQDLKPESFLRELRGQGVALELASTHPGHRTTGANGIAGGQARPRDQTTVYETSPSGNAVVIEEQLTKAAESQMDYQLMTSLYRRHLEMLRRAVGRGG